LGTSCVARLPEPRHEASDMHIMVVEDNYDVIQLVQNVLSMDGHTVTVARDGLEALQRDAANRPDAIILDVNLPHIDGYEVCRRIKARRDVPIMLLTVRAERADIEVSRAAGADLHMSKPFDLQDFLQHIAKLDTLRRAV
jgi:CheY-like chemotaxis protein